MTQTTPSAEEVARQERIALQLDGINELTPPQPIQIFAPFSDTSPTQEPS